MKKRETVMFRSEFVSVVDAVVAGETESGFVGGTEKGSIVIVANVAKDLH